MVTQFGTKKYIVLGKVVPEHTAYLNGDKLSDEDKKKAFLTLYWVGPFHIFNDKDMKIFRELVLAFCIQEDENRKARQGSQA